ncbi:hypothetical protein FRB94_006722 [Tulasnella sp. JGI-2019a]|nr:hypothetical protein FRB94_006722 [Tulasnella sp. JGI-2019a]
MFMLPSSAPDEPHPAVRVPELVLRIFSQLPTKDLAVAAAVCKNWEWKATDTLWRLHPVKLSVLLRKIAPVGSYLYEESPSQDGCLAFSLQTMTADVWQNFLHQYSHKVSHLLVDISFVPLYGATTLSWSQAYGPICSNATSVTFISRETAQSEGRLSDWDAVLGVLVPSSSRALTSINVSNWTFLQISNLQGNSIPYKSPFVTTATFRVLWSHPEYTNFPALTNLVLHGTFMSRLDWENLSTGCPRLRHLELDLMHGRHNDDDVDDDDDADKRLIDFPSLWSFNLRKQSNEVHDTWDLVDMIFADCTMPSLDNFSLSNIRLSPTDLHDIFVYLGDFDQLEVIEIHVQAVFGTMLDIRDVLENVPWVDSLIRLRILNQSSWFEMHDKDWEALGSHMTEMKEIAIEQEPTRGECHHGTTCTMRSLLSMAKHCKDLERLVISLHVSSDFAFTGVPYCTRCKV